jgi:preprotein translocase subunit SecD
MRTLFIVLGICITGIFAARAETLVGATNKLCFFVVSEKPIANGRYINSQEFPKLGYISNAPSYVLTRLRETSTNDVTSTTIMNGKIVSTNISAGISITLFPEDAKTFYNFTEENVLRKVLLMLGDQPVAAPRISEPIENGNVRLDSGTNGFSKKVIDGIQNLTRDK